MFEHTITLRLDTLASQPFEDLSGRTRLWGCPCKVLSYKIEPKAPAVEAGDTWRNGDEGTAEAYVFEVRDDTIFYRYKLDIGPWCSCQTTIDKFRSIYSQKVS